MEITYFAVNDKTITWRNMHTGPTVVLRVQFKALNIYVRK